MDTITVMINDQIVHSELARSDGYSMMLARTLRKKYLIADLIKNEIVAGVTITKEDGTVFCVGNNFSIAQSKMNDPEFVPEPAWYDDQIENYAHE